MQPPALGAIESAAADALRWTACPGLVRFELRWAVMDVGVLAFHVQCGGKLVARFDRECCRSHQSRAAHSARARQFIEDSDVADAADSTPAFPPEVSISTPSV